MANIDDTNNEKLQDAPSTDEKTQDEQLSTLQEMKRQAREADEAPSGSLRLRDVLGGEFLWALVRRHAWLIILIVLITSAYVAVRYQCQQDAIDISQLERELVNAKFESLSSSSNLTRMSRKSNIEKMMETNDSLQLHSAEPPYIIDVPEENK